jgi:hypothetical protein
VTLGAIGGLGRINVLKVKPLHWTAHVIVVPDFGEDIPITAEIGNYSNLGLERVLYRTKIVGFRFGRVNASVCEQLICGKLFNPSNRCSGEGRNLWASYHCPRPSRRVEIVDEVVIRLEGRIAFRIKGGDAGSMLVVFVSPELGVFFGRGDPIFSHEIEKITSTCASKNVRDFAEEIICVQ